MAEQSKKLEAEALEEVRGQQPPFAVRANFSGMDLDPSMLDQQL